MTAIGAKVERRTHAERRREAEARILEAAFEIVARSGVDQLTLAEAGEMAGYSRALPAHYFGSREELLSAVAEHAVQAYRSRVKLKDPRPRGGLASLLAGISFYINDSRKWPKKLRAFYEVMNAALRWPSIAPVIARLNDEAVERYASYIRIGQEDGEIRADLDPMIEAVAIAGAVRGIMTQWLVAPQSIDLDKVRDAYLAALKRSLSSEP